MPGVLTEHGKTQEPVPERRLAQVRVTRLVLRLLKQLLDYNTTTILPLLCLVDQKDVPANVDAHSGVLLRVLRRSSGPVRYTVTRSSSAIGGKRSALGARSACRSRATQVDRPRREQQFGGRARRACARARATTTRRRRRSSASALSRPARNARARARGLSRELFHARAGARAPTHTTNATKRSPPTCTRVPEHRPRRGRDRAAGGPRARGRRRWSSAARPVLDRPFRRGLVTSALARAASTHCRCRPPRRAGRDPRRAPADDGPSPEARRAHRAPARPARPRHLAARRRAGARRRAAGARAPRARQFTHVSEGSPSAAAAATRSRRLNERAESSVAARALRRRPSPTAW